MDIKTDTTTMNDKFYETFITVVPECIRLDFLPAKLKGNFNAIATFENNVCAQAKIMSDDYTGANWEFTESKDGNAFFIHPSLSDGPFIINDMNTQREYTVDSRVFGLLATWIIFSRASFAFEHKDREASIIFSNHYHALRNAFYSLLDDMIYNETIELTAEQKEEIKVMSNIVYSYLD